MRIAQLSLRANHSLFPLKDEHRHFFPGLLHQRHNPAEVFLVGHGNLEVGSCPSMGEVSYESDLEELVGLQSVHLRLHPNADESSEFF